MAGWPRIAAPAPGIALALALCPAEAHAAGTLVRPASVLFVDAGDGGRPAFSELMSGFRDRLRGATGLAPVSVSTVSMDVTSLSSPAAREALETLVRERYGAQPIGAIVAFREPTFDAAIAWRDRLWPDASIVAVADSDAGERRARATPHCTVMRLEMSGRATVRIALALLPQTRRVVVVAGREFREPPGANQLAWLRSIGNEVEPLVGLPMPDLLDRVAALPERSVVFFGGLNLDGAGRRFSSRDALDLVAARANAPVFVNVSTLVGRGVVGGAVIDFSAVGRATADRVLEQLRGEAPATPAAADFTRLVFDGREIDRWKLSESALPPGATVLYRPPTLWEEHRGKVVVFLAVATAQTIAIGTLLLHRRRRREAEEGLRRLSTRLMTAQEDERRRIARDLHDDVCQRLVLLAVDLDLLEGTEGDEGDERDAGGRAPGEIAESARALSADVQRIAYRLHPASLDRLGLLHAAQRFARDATSRTGVRIETVIEDWPERELPRDVALALYRVVQEALQNVVRHSGATYARVAFRGGGGGVTVRIDDDGAGFDPTLVADAGLGLTSMRERLQLHGGRLTVVSSPGNGTVVEAWVPAGAFAAPAAQATHEAPA